MNKLLLSLFVFGCFYTTHASSVEAIENPPINLFVCDDNDDGFAIFDLTQNDAIVLGTQNPTDFTITYHLSQADASTNVAALANANAFTSSDATIFVRVEEVANTDLFEIGVFNLFVNPIPPIVIPLPDLELSNDGTNQAVFDLTINESAILGSLDPTLYGITYHESQLDADSDTLPIGDPSNYLVASPGGVIWVRLENINTGCASIASFNLTIVTIPIQPAPFELCDDIESGSDSDELSIFDLSSRNDEITGGNPDFIVSYHLTESDANSGTPTLPNMYQNVVPASQTIWARAENINTGSFGVTTLTLIVNQLPSPSPIPDVMVCDDNDDGIGFFDLQLLQDDILNGETSASLSFHETLESAELGTPAIDITVPYASIANPQTIYVRATDIDLLTTTECFRIITITLITNPIPLISTPSNIIVCNDDSTNDDPIGTISFDLTLNTDILTGGDDSLNVTYYASLADLNSDTPIITPEAYTNITNPQTIQVLVTSSEGCFSQTNFDIEVLPLPSPGQPSDIISCDTNDDGDATNGLVEFDLSETVAIIEGGENVTVTIFDDLTLAEATPFDPANVVTTVGAAGEILYTNTISGGQTLYARVDSTVSIIDGIPCFVVVEMNLIVESCVDTDNDGVLDEDEDLNGNGNLDDDDTDNDTIPNYLDDDDDGDLVMTIDEITGIGAGFAPQDFIDTDNDLIENYLDNDDDGDTVLTKDEDYNNSGSPLDDDINMNDIPDFLDPDVALSTDEFIVTDFTIYPNPAIDNITITGSNPFEKISIYDITGKLVLEQATEAQITHTISIPSIKTGMYFIRIDNQSSAIRFIKK